MPCTAKKYEAKRPQNAAVEHLPDVDAVLTTRELAVMIKRAGLIWDNLPEEKFDDDLIGEYSGAGAIFGVTGGVMEAALRTAYHTLNGKEHDPIEFKAVRGLEAVKEAEVDMGKAGKVKVAVTSGMANAKPLLDQVRAGKSPLRLHRNHVLPRWLHQRRRSALRQAVASHQWRRVDSRHLPTEAGDILYSIDDKKSVRQSHNNPDIIRLYQDYLGELWFGKGRRAPPHQLCEGSRAVPEEVVVSLSSWVASCRPAFFVPRFCVVLGDFPSLRMQGIPPSSEKPLLRIAEGTNWG
jgi:NADP-reducing hydrogenase subunit HndD